MAFTGSFLGFSYSLDDGTLVHSSTLGIVRVSDGDRFNDGMIPSFKDKTISVNGANKTYYFGQDYTQRQFNVNFAYEKLTDAQLRTLRQLFGDKKIHKLIFDETPYKAYWVKPVNNPQLKYMAFDDGDTTDNSYIDPRNYPAYDPNNPFAPNDPVTKIYRANTPSSARWYNGEGSISFVAYEPFAQSVHKYYNEYSATGRTEWYRGITLKNSTDTDTAGTHTIDTYNISDKKIFVYNPGDFDTDFKLYVEYSSSTVNPFSIQYNNTDNQFALKGFTLQGSGEAGSYADIGFVIDTKLHVIEGFYKQSNNIVRSGRIYNQYITNGDFFKIPICSGNNYLNITTTDTPNITIDYKYLFY